MELFLAKLLGLYFIIMGIIVLARRKAVIPTIKDLSRNRPLVLVIAVIELAAGIALVLQFPVVSQSLNGLFALVGYMMVVESIIYLAAPASMVQKFIGRFNRPLWYVAGGALAIVAGIFLAGTGFGII